MTAVPSRPPDTADRPRCTTFMPFIHRSTRSSNAPILGTLRAARTCHARRRCHSQHQVPGALARGPECYPRGYRIAAADALGALACPTRGARTGVHESLRPGRAGTITPTSSEHSTKRPTIGRRRRHRPADHGATHPNPRASRPRTRTVRAINMSLGRCFRVSGSHRLGRLPSTSGQSRFDETDEYSQFADRYQLAGATVYEAEPGDALLFSALTIHGSGPNLSSNVLRPYWCSSTPDGPSWRTPITRSSDSCYEGGINMRPESRSHERHPRTSHRTTPNRRPSGGRRQGRTSSLIERPRRIVRAGRWGRGPRR
jgi:hypothetical protein